MKEVTDNSFEQDVLKAPHPVLVDFWAKWCGPCKMMAPVLESLAEEYAGRLEIVTVDVDENPATAQRCGIRAMPTLMVFQDGEVKGQKLGALSRGQLKTFLDSFL
ncbi:MAG: thioredoxin TrxA [Burkholderiales bacterium]|jgi:thioredoxin 1|nr:thioredoxin TrxA [Burkholderiales bacterium]